jgi:hypothetical protein
VCIVRLHLTKVYSLSKTKPNCEIWNHIKITQFKNLVWHSCYWHDDDLSKVETCSLGIITKCRYINIYLVFILYIYNCCVDARIYVIEARLMFWICEIIVNFFTPFTNSMMHSPSEAKSRSVSQEIPRLLRNENVHCRPHKSRLNCLTVNLNLGSKCLCNDIPFRTSESISRCSDGV